MPFFEGAIGVNASHGIFNDITGSQYNNWNTHDTHNTNSGNTTNKIFQDSYNTDSYNKSFNRGGSYAGQLYLNSTRNTNSASQVTPVLSQGDITREFDVAFMYSSPLHICLTSSSAKYSVP
jgi:hypothetical protein